MLSFVGRRVLCRNPSTAIRPYRTLGERFSEIDPKTLFQRIGIDHEDEAVAAQRDPEELRKWYVRHISTLRPGVVDGDTEKLRDASEAFKTLMDGIAAQGYTEAFSPSPDVNLNLRVDGSTTPFGNYSAEHVKFDFEQQPQHTFSDFTSSFETITNSTYRHAEPPDDGKPHRGADIPFLLHLSFDEALHGCTKLIEYARMLRCKRCTGSGKARKQPKRCPVCHGRGYTTLPSGTYMVKQECTFCKGEGKAPVPPCKSCNGQGVIRGKEQREVTFPPCSDATHRVKVQGAGDNGVRGGAAGTLLVRCIVGEHRLIHRHGSHLHTIAAVPLTVALLGGMITVETLDGPSQVRVPPGASSGTMLTITGRGVAQPTPSLSTGVGLSGRSESDQAPIRGDLKVHLVVAMPKEVTGRQRQALRVIDADAPKSLNDDGTEHVTRVGDAPYDRIDAARMADAKAQFSHWLPSTDMPMW